MIAKVISSVKYFFSNSFQELKASNQDFLNAKILWRYFLLFTAGSALLIQFLTYSAVLFNTSESRPIVATADDDTQDAIRLTQNTYLINDNGARAYGPVYYRLASVARFFGANSFYDFKLSPAEQSEKSTYFSLMIVNLLAIFAYCFLLASLIHPLIHLRLIFTFGLVHAFLQNDLRSTLSFMGKPDHVLVFFTSLAFLYSWKWLASFDNKNNLLKSAAAWALAASTKLSTLFFAPGILSFWIFRKWDATKWSFLFFLKWLIIFYFLIGFPQNFEVPSYLRYLLQQNAHTSLVTWEFFTQKWLVLFAKDL